MKPFDLEAATRGDPVCFTANGKPVAVRFIGTMGNGAPVVEVDGKPHIAGKFALFMMPKKRTVYANVYHTFKTEDAARLVAAKSAIAVAVAIEIED